MTRFHGKVGYATPGEVVDGVWSDSILEVPYYGSVLNETANTNESEKVNADAKLSSRISLVADAYAMGHYSNIKYVIDGGGVFWQVTSVELKRPRLIISTGGIYHGPKP